jgi:hypothetical protein
MFTPATTNTHAPAADTRKVGAPGRWKATLPRRVGALAVGALLAATLSVALPLQVHAVRQPDGHSTANDSTGLLSHTPVGITIVALPPTKGQKG